MCNGGCCIAFVEGYGGGLVEGRGPGRVFGAGVEA